MLRVLVVDDEQNTTDTMRLLLEGWGFVALPARFGAAAVKLVNHLRPDVVLLDMGLSGMDGLGVAWQIRQFGGKQPVIICLTGYRRTEDRIRAREAGCDHFLLRPLDHDELKTLLRALEAQPNA